MGKIRDIKGTFHVKIGFIKDRNGMDLTEAEDIKKNLTLHLKQLEKEEMKNPRVSNRKEILKIRAEINAKETKKTIAKINKAKSCFFEKIKKKLTKHWQDSLRNKGRRTKLTKIEMKMKRS